MIIADTTGILRGAVAYNGELYTVGGSSPLVAVVFAGGDGILSKPLAAYRMTSNPGMYSFTLPEGVGMPLRRLGGSSGGGGKVSLNLDLNYSKDKSENLTARSITSEITRFSVVPKATYTFSRNMNGNLNAKFAQDSDHKRGQTTRTIGLGIELTIKF